MDRSIDRSHMDAALTALVGACDVEGGPTEEQWALVGAAPPGVTSCMADTEVHWVRFLGNLGVHEARFVHHNGVAPGVR